MFPRRRRARTARDQGSPLVAAEQVVRTAEAIVGRAWAEHLIRRRGELDWAVKAAYETSEAAYQRLATAQRGRDPRKISLAQAALERALEAGRASAAERDRTMATLREHLDALRDTTDKRMRAATRGHEHRESVIATTLPIAPGHAAGGRPDEVSAGSHSCRPRLWWRLRRSGA
jgi:hypothetical protein